MTGRPTPLYNRVRIKICGITTPEYATAVVQAGADGIGLIFHQSSPRAVTLSTARAIRAALPPLVSAVAVLVNPDREQVLQVIESCRPDVLQFHGDEAPAVCEQYGLPWIKALRVRTRMELSAQIDTYRNASALLLDTFDDRRWGGSGKPFDWSLIPSAIPIPLILAGGLSPNNIASAITRVAPFGVDVSGGVESAPGVKDPALIRSFISEVRRVESIQSPA